MMNLGSNLKFGRDATLMANEDTLVIPPSEYFIVIPGYKESASVESEHLVVPPNALDLMNSWTIDFERTTQFILNKFLLLKHPDLNGGPDIQNNAFTLGILKTFHQNNIRILLHADDNPSILSNQLFWVDIDENNLLFVTNIRTGRNTHSDYFNKLKNENSILTITVFLVEDTIIVIAGQDSFDFSRIILTFQDDDLARVNGVNVNKLDTYSVRITELIVFNQKVPLLENYAKLKRSLAGIY